METGLEYNGHVVGIEHPVFVYVTSSNTSYLYAGYAGTQ